MKIKISRSHLKNISQAIVNRMKNFPEGGKIILLEGEMGTGKTTFSNDFLENLCLEKGSSPSFALVQVYENREVCVVHADFQRIAQEEAIHIFEEYEAQYPNAFFLIEWPFENWKEYFNQPIIHVQLEHGEDASFRYLEMSFYNPWAIDLESAKKMQEEWKTPIHVRKHIELVHKVSVFCARQLEAQGIPIDINLVESAAILHDGVRYIDFKSFEEFDLKYYKEEVTPEKIAFWKSVQKKYQEVGHEKAMRMILESQGFFATGKVIEAHRSKKIYEKDQMSWEEKCLYYADKRAMHDQFVSLQKRLEDGAMRYGHARTENFESLVFELEKELQKAGKWKEVDLQDAIV